jgi:putative ABC transport system permease protein
MSKKPPRIAASLLMCVLPPRDRDYLLGDYEESFQRKLQEKGALSASLWYWGQLVHTAPEYLLESFYWRIVMFRNYFKVASRNIVRRKPYSAINILGLAIGLACCIWISLYVVNDVTYDTFHSNLNSIYRMKRINYEPDGSVENQNWHFPPIMREQLSEYFPEMELHTRYNTGYGVVHYQNKRFPEYIGMADAPFFQIFTFPLISGDPQTVLVRDEAIVITQSAATRYFGEADPIGKILTIARGNTQKDFIVTGVAQDVPRNSTIQFYLLINMSNMPFAWEYPSALTTWRSFNTPIFCLLKENTDVKNVENKFKPFYEQHFSWYTEKERSEGSWNRDGNPFAITLQPMKDIHLNPEVSRGSSPKPLYILSGIALMILMIGCMNFVNLSIGTASFRSTEVGIRKVIGAQRRQLIQQFWSESIIMVVLSMIVGIGLAAALLPIFNELSGEQFILKDFSSINNLFVFISLIVLAGIASGSYPALVMANLNPVRILKGKLKFSRKRMFSKSLVIFQFSLSIILIISSVVLRGQLKHLVNTNVGYDREGLMSINILRRDDQERFVNLFKNEVVQHSGVLAVSACETVFGVGFSELNMEKEGKEINFHHCQVGYDFIETMGMNILEGRDFSNEITSDGEGAIIVNQTFVKELGFESPVGKTLGNPSRGHPYNLRIIGILEDYHFRSLHQEIYPSMLHVYPSNGLRFMVVRISSTDTQETLAFLEKAWEEVRPGEDFVYSFLIDSQRSLYANERRWSEIVQYTSLLAIIIACMGIFGLTAITMNNRVKEIGIRKVLGAKITQIINLIIKDFIILVAVANIISWPIVFYIMHKVLENYPYRIGISINYFLFSGLASSFIAVLAILWLVVKAATSNPVDSLRYE